jgi:transcription elongation factor Elf1
VIRTMFECPETGEPLTSTTAFGRFPGGEVEAVTRHCPKCGQLHRFEVKDAIILIDGAERPAEVVGALAET